MPDKCPFCGCEERKTSGSFISFYECGTYLDPDYPKWIQHDKCYERQIAALQAKLELWREASKFVTWLRLPLNTKEWNDPYLINAQRISIRDRLKEAGEVA